MADRPRTPHWFEPVADHLGAAYLRYSFTRGTEQEVDFLVRTLGLAPGMKVLDVGCGPGRHLAALAARGLPGVGVDISARFAAVARGQGLTVIRGDARALPVRPRSVDVALSLCQGGFGLPDPGRALDDDTAVLAGIAEALRPGGRVALTAFSAYFQLRFFEADRDRFDADTGVHHERTDVRSEDGAVAEVEVWTACYTPRELRLLCRSVGLTVESVWSVWPGDYAARPPDIDRPEYLVVARRDDEARNLAGDDAPVAPAPTG